VVAELAKALPGQDVKCADVWLLRPPSGSGVQEYVWSVVAVVALAAMAHGRATLWHLSSVEGSRAGREGDAQTLITDFYPVASTTGDRSLSASCVERAARRAAVRFWLLLQDFVQYGVAPAGWPLDPTLVGHPFVGVSPNGRLVLNLPPHYHLPDMLDD
jgi:hypothetical protein